MPAQLSAHSTSSSATSSKVLAIVVSYQPTVSELRENIAQLESQVEHIYLVDNASSNQADISDAFGKHPSITVDLQARNLGLGAAHNLGIRYAQQAHYDYVLLLDQDTQMQADSVSALLTAIRSKANAGIKVSGVGSSYAHGRQQDSVYIRFGALKFSRHGADEQDDHGCVATDFLISSGTLIALQAVEEVGLMDESLFIDHVDTEWFLRARSKSLQAFGVCAARIEHSLGETAHAIRFAGRDRDVPQHQPFRYYYIFRNSVLLYRRSYPSGLWKWNDLQRLLMILVVYGFMKPPRWQNLRMMAKGLWHGMRGISGRMIESHAQLQSNSDR